MDILSIVFDVFLCKVDSINFSSKDVRNLEYGLKHHVVVDLPAYLPTITTEEFDSTSIAIVCCA